MPTKKQTLANKELKTAYYNSGFKAGLFQAEQKFKLEITNLNNKLEDKQLDAKLKIINALSQSISSIAQILDELRITR